MAGERINRSGSATRVLGTTVALLAFMCQTVAAARELKQNALPNVPFPTRLFWDPNNGDVDRINDYLEVNPQIGIVDIAEADPTIAAAGAAANVAIAAKYDTSSQNDYESPTSRFELGPGAKAVGAAVARVLGLGAFKGLGKASASSRARYTRDAYNGNSATIGTVDTLGGSGSLGLYLDSSGASAAADKQPKPVVGLFGR